MSAIYGVNKMNKVNNNNNIMLSYGLAMVEQLEASLLEASLKSIHTHNDDKWRRRCSSNVTALMIHVSRPPDTSGINTQMPAYYSPPSLVRDVDGMKHTICTTATHYSAEFA